MTNQLTEIRRGIVAKLQAQDLHAFDHLPETITPPFAFVGPGDPYVHYGEPGETTFGQEIVDHVVVLVADTGTNEVKVEALDDMICAALRALEYSPEQVDQPGLLNISGIGDCYAVALPVRNIVSLT